MTREPGAATVTNWILSKCKFIHANTLSLTGAFMERVRGLASLYLYFPPMFSGNRVQCKVASHTIVLRSIATAEAKFVAALSKGRNLK